MPRPHLCRTHCSVLPIPPCAATVFTIRSTSLATRHCPAPTASPVPPRARRTTKGFGDSLYWPRTSTSIWPVSHTGRSTLSTPADVSVRHETSTPPPTCTLYLDRTRQAGADGV